MALITRGLVSDHGAPTDGISSATSAFTNYRDWAVAWQASNPDDTHALDFEDAYTFVITGNGTWILEGIKTLTVEGRGGTLSDGGSGQAAFFLGGHGVNQNDANSARIDTALVGSLSVTLKDIAKASLFTVGRWVLLCGVDLQGAYRTAYGYPHNPQWFEYLKISDITDDVITFTTALKNTYLDTWPEQNDGSTFEIDNGGPGTLYVLPLTWDMDVTYKDLTIDKTGQQTYANARRVVYQNVDATGALGPIPTQNAEWTATGCDFSGVNMEVDKLIDVFNFNDSVINRMTFQSASTNTFNSDSSRFLIALLGSAKKANITNPTIGENNTGQSIALIGPGPTYYGTCGQKGSFRMTGGTVSTTGQLFQQAGSTLSSSFISGIENGIIKIPRGTLITGAADNGSGNVRFEVENSAGFVTGKTAFVQNVSGLGSSLQNGTNTTITVIDATHIDVSVAYSGTYVSGGRITAGGTAGDALPWAIPGNSIYLDGSGTYFQPRYTAKIVSVYDDDDFIYVETDTDYNAFPGSGSFNIAVVNCNRVYIRNVTAAGVGKENFDDLQRPQSWGKAIDQYVFRTYDKTTTTGASSGNRPRLRGYLQSIKINVLTPYTGTGTLTWSLSAFHNWPWLDQDYVARNLTIIVNAKVAGERILIPGQAAQGAQSGDTLPDLTAYTILALRGQSNSNPVFSKSVSGEDNGPIITLEMISDLGIEKRANTWQMVVA